ncbi:MAG: hypothetical protein RRA94_14865, partial [Bacteroidota bacterium]|nr:hypothetical protein [Bacteroidota bacterium]
MPLRNFFRPVPVAAFTASILLATLLQIGCSSSNSVELVSFRPEGEVPVLSTLEFEFSRDLAPPNRQDAWLDEEFVRFEPDIPGRFKWVSPRLLLFSP